MNNNGDTSDDLWERRFLIRMPYLDSVNEDFLKLHGTYITGDKNIDNTIINNWITTYANIDTMVEFYKKGVIISVINPEDTRIIYECIERHLRAWISRIEAAFSIGNAPIDDLILLDKFASIVYPHAKYHFDYSNGTSEFLQNINEKFKGFTFDTLFDKPKPTQTYEQERKSHSEFFKRRIYGG